VTQVFISYRHINPDQDLAGFLEGYLKSRGIDVFIDTQMLVGDKWVEEIDRRIRASSFFVALLSADSIRSDMVRQEVELAHSLPSCSILPVRVAFEGALPYDLASYLNRIQYAQWKSRDDNQTIAEQIFAAINRSASLPNQGQSGETQSSAAELQALADVTEIRGAPLPAATKRGLKVLSQAPLPVIYDGVKIAVGYRIDLLVEDAVIVELKAVEKLTPLNEAQLLSYLKLSGRKLGLLINFNVEHLKNGIKRIANGL
jgi:GxxExxY protein